MYRARPSMPSIFRISGSQSRPSLDTARHLGAIGGDPYCGDWQCLALEHPSGFRTGQMHSDPASGATIADPRRQHMCSRCSVGTRFDQFPDNEPAAPEKLLPLVVRKLEADVALKGAACVFRSSRAGRDISSRLRGQIGLCPSCKRLRLGARLGRARTQNVQSQSQMFEGVFAQLGATIRHCSKLFETPRPDLSRR